MDGGPADWRGNQSVGAFRDLNHAEEISVGVLETTKSSPGRYLQG